jgi:putative redox protein
MKVVLTRMNDAVHFTASAGSDPGVQIDGAPSVGGEDKGMRPMQLLLSALGSCSGIDVVSILQKQKQKIGAMRVHVDGEREEGAVPSVFRKIQIHFELQGTLDPHKVERAIDLSINKYCSVAKMIEGVADITTSFEIKEN